MIRWAATFIWLGILSASGANYFVDFVGGSDANNGTSTNTPWKHSPWSVNATGVSDGTTLVAGDTVWFKAGVTNITRHSIVASGTPGNPITHRVATNWGTGTKAYFTLTNAPLVSCWVVGSSTTAKSNLWFKGMDIRNYGGWPATDPVFSGPANSISSDMGRNRQGHAFVFNQSVNDSVFEDLVMAENGHYRNVIQNAAGTCVVGSGLNFDRGGLRNKIISCVASNQEFGIRFASRGPSSPVLFNVLTNCELKGDHRWGLTWTMLANGGVIKSNEVWTTWIHDYQGYDDVNWLGGGEEPHTNGGAHFNNTYTETDWGDGGVRYYRCRFTYDDSIDPRPGGGTSMLFVSRNPSIWVDSCYFFSIKQPIYITIPWDNMVSTVNQTQYIRIRNNTFFTPGPTLIRLKSQNAMYTITNRRVEFEGNMIIANGNHRAILMDDTVAQTTNMLRSMNGNLYWNTTLSQPSWTRLSTILGVNRTLAGLQAIGREADGLFGDPVLTNAFKSPWWQANASPLVGSAAIGAGLNLTNLVGVDFYGTSRIGRPITIGATLEQTGSSPPPPDTNAPTPNPLTWIILPSVQSVSQTAVTVTMEWSPATDDSGDPVTYTVTEHTGNPGCSSVESTAETTFTDTGIPFETECTYSVTARDASGNTTSPSVQETVSTPPQPPPVLFTATNLRVGSLYSSSIQEPLRLFYFDAETATTPSGFTNTGTVAWDDNFAPFQGAYAFYIENTASSYTSVKWDTATNQLSMVFALRRTTIGADKRKLIWGGLDGNDLFGIRFGNMGMDFYHGAVSNSVAFTGAVSTWYTGLLKLATGSGANGYMSLVVHTNFSFNDSTWTNQITTGTATGNINQMFFGNQLGSAIGPVRFDYTGAKGGTNAYILNNPVP